MTTTPIAETETHALRITRRSQAPIELLWEALTDRSMAEQWLGPEGFTTKIIVWGEQPGAAYRFIMRSEDGKEYPAYGVITEIQRPTIFAYTWVIEDDDGLLLAETYVRTELSEVQGGTEMLFTHTGFPLNIPSHEKGWSSAFNKLETLLERLAGRAGGK